MKKHFPLLTLLLGLSVTTVASPIQPQRAKQLAENFFGGIKARKAPLKITYQAQNNANTGNSLYYIINRDNNQGFVVVSGDTRTRAILAYADKGNLDEETLRDNPTVAGMFQEYADQIEWAQQNVKDIPSQSYKRLAAREDYNEPKHIIEPLLAVDKNNREMLLPTPISWGQRWPFNAYSPSILYNGVSYKTVSGCVATGISTVLRWHKWPARPTGSTSYTWERTRKQMRIDYDAQPAYDWNNMPEGVTGSGYDRATNRKLNNTQADNIGRLLRDVGYGVRMNFGPPEIGGSGALLTAATSTLVDNFGYDGRLSCLMRFNYSDNQWWAGIQDELTNYGPIVYAGFSQAGGHCFVIDGLAEDRYVHVDWGWNGMSNCWTSIDVLEPDTHGDGGGVGAFSKGHQMLRYLMPGNGNFEAITVSKGPKQTTFARENNQSIEVTFKNNKVQYFYGTFRLLISKAGMNSFQTLAQSYKVMVNGDAERSYTFSANLSRFQDGQYDLRISYSADDATWTDIKENIATITIGNGKPDPKPEPNPVVKNQFSIAQKCQTTQVKQQNNQQIQVALKNNSTDAYYGYFKLVAKKAGQQNEIQLATTSSKAYMMAGDTKNISFNADFRNVEKGAYDLRIAYVANQKWTEIDESAGYINVNANAMGAKIVATTMLPTLSTNEGEPIKVEVPVMNQGDEDYNGKVQLLANGNVISEGNATITVEEKVVLAFSTNNAAFNNLKQGTYKLSVAYNNGNKVMYGTTENIGTLVIKTKNNSDPAKGDVRLNSAFFYQNGKYVGSKYCTVAKDADLVIKANLYSSNGFNGPVRVFITDQYGSKVASSNALQTVQNITIGQYGSGYIEVKFNKNELTSNHYYVYIAYNDGTKEVFRSWDGVAFYVSKGSSYRGRTYYGLYDMGMTVCTDNMPTGITYIPVGIDNVNVAAGSTNGIENINVQNVKLYPSIANETVTIVADAAATAYIYNATGTKMATIALAQGNNTVDVSQFTPGIYLVKVNKNTLKFIKK
jgi:peptidase C10 family protein